MSQRRDPVVCPKPRRLGLFNASVSDLPVRSPRWHPSHRAETGDAIAGNDILDIILTKGGYVAEQSCIQAASSPPPFFCGSPPSRAANPLIQDARFADENHNLISPLMPVPIQPPPSGLSSSSATSSARKGGYARAKFGNKPDVRIEGFDCLGRDSRNCSIPALA